MIRLILTLLLIGACEGRCDLINTQSAATDLCGIQILRDENLKAALDELPLVVSYDRAKVGPVLEVVVRNKEFKEVGKFEYAAQSTETEVGMGQARFSLNRDYLHRSFLKTESYIIPLRLYFDVRGKSIDASKNPKVEATSSYALMVWPVNLAFYKTQYALAKINNSDASGAEPVHPQSKTEEELFRFWGLVPPEGTVFYSGQGKSAVVVRSTKGFFNKLESELKKRGFLVEDKK